MSAETTPCLLALDWGTSALRAYLVAAGGGVLERRVAPHGILQIKDGRFEEALTAVAGDWLARHPRLPALASGMIGSRQGWREAPYVETPSGLDELARALVTVALSGGRRLFIVPGVAQKAPPDVMRGEETQILGSLAAADAAPTLFVLPGTHSKWAIAEAGRIVWFATFMTGELYAVLKNHSILARLMAGEAADESSFRRGLAAAAVRDPAAGGLLHKLFSARTLALFEALPAAGVASYLSGLLVGSELEEALGAVSARLGGAQHRITLIGEAALQQLYRTALDGRRIRMHLAAAEAAAPGLLRIARAAGLVA